MGQIHATESPKIHRIRICVPGLDVARARRAADP